MGAPKFYRIYLTYFKEIGAGQQHVEFYTATLGEAVRGIKCFKEKHSLCGHICKYTAEDHLAFWVDRSFGVDGYLHFELRNEEGKPIVVKFTNV